ncbi:MAG: DUF29 domain-containing protein [Candidatus Competibacteraceae bacterium]|nr:DUF29 domain-containing protein [Candidatus Competibacteraceae bacterium]
MHSQSDLHVSDVYAWALQNAELIRQRRFAEIDIDNVAGALESVGRHEQDALAECLTGLLARLLRWRHQLTRREKSWQTLIQDQRAHVQEIFAKNPSLRVGLEALVRDVYSSARQVAACEANLKLELFPQDCPFQTEQVLDPSYWPGSH